MLMDTYKPVKSLAHVFQTKMAITRKLRGMRIMDRTVLLIEGGII